jgi:hypothetical protein
MVNIHNDGKLDDYVPRKAMSALDVGCVVTSARNDPCFRWGACSSGGMHRKVDG